MTQKQIYWLAGSLAILCGVVAWQVTGWQSAGMPGNLATADGHDAGEIDVTYVVAPGDDPEKERTTPSKRKKAVQKEDNEVKYNKLTPEEARVIMGKGTERAFTGEYTVTTDPGTYICKRCNAPLYHSDDKFESHCGWPSFDDEIKDAVKRRREIDGTGRIEIVCANCGGHLGHVFLAEGYTAKNTRHCVNSVSMKLIPKGKELPAVIKPKDVKRSKSSDNRISEAQAKDNKQSSDDALDKPAAERAPATKPGGEK